MASISLLLPSALSFGTSIRAFCFLWLCFAASRYDLMGWAPVSLVGAFLLGALGSGDKDFHCIECQSLTSAVLLLLESAVSLTVELEMFWLRSIASTSLFAIAATSLLRCARKIVLLSLEIEMVPPLIISRRLISSSLVVVSSMFRLSVWTIVNVVELTEKVEVVLHLLVKTGNSGTMSSVFVSELVLLPWYSRKSSVKIIRKRSVLIEELNCESFQRGLVGVVTITPFHKHSLMTPESLRFLPAEDCREQFEGYFSDRMGPAESAKYHKGVLEMNADFHPVDLANSRINPTQRVIEYCYEKWRLLNIGPRNGHGMIEAVSSLVWDSKYGIPNNDRRQLMSHFQQIIFGKGSKTPAQITSEGQWETMLATLGINVPLKKKAGVGIRVKPTSIARRSIGVTRGGKRAASSRPSNGSQVSKKEE
ncbi:hypothetical protein AVEN_88671-1 [Araneus ventricosus]|uniref:Uncharacterized protein n=1 Tax=Araneus ventricosus TaxID=182803 RepID=A0A4Y2JKX3_ARAVE|nr:hypothetical protein AVEN_88671-1 [Araneus ventricosus]